MKKYSKVLSLLLALAMILPGFAQAAPVSDLKIERLSGNTRVETAIEVSKEAYDKADTVVLAGYNGEADALTGTLLAEDKNAPLLLTYKDKLDAGLESEMARLGVKNVYILGGTTVVFPAVEEALKAKGFNVVRLEGRTRVETAVAIAEEVLGKTVPSEAFVVEYNALVDALAIGGVAATKKAPILITYKDRVPSNTLEAIQAMQIKKATIVGGVNVVSAAGKAELEKDIAAVGRVSGLNRIETALAVANEYISNPEAVIVANGYTLADALVGGYFAAKINAPILLTQTDKIHEDVLAYVNKVKAPVYVLGGLKAVSEKVFDALGEETVVETLELSSVEAIAKNQLKVKLNKEIDTAKAQIEVKKGSVNVNIEKIEFAADKMGFNITTTTNLTNGDYTVIVKGLTTEDLSKTVTVANEKVTTIKVAEKAPRKGNSDADSKIAIVSYEVLNQYGDKMVGQTINWTTSTGKSLADSTGKFEIESPNNNVFVPGTSVYLTGVHANSGTVVNTQVEIVLESQPSKVVFKGVYDINKSEMTNLPAGFAADKYDLLVEVLDQYGNKIENLTSEQLGKIVFTSNNPLFVKGNFVSDTNRTVDGVSYTALKLVPGEMASKGGTVNIEAISTVTGERSSYTIDANALSQIKTFTMQAPSKMVSEGEKIEISFTAVDQYGNPVTSFKALNGKVNLSPVATLKFEEQQDGSAKLFFTAPIEGLSDNIDLPVYLTSVVNDGGNFSSLMINVKAKAKPTTIVGLKSTIPTSVADQNNVEILGSDLNIQDQYGREMSTAAKNAWLNTANNAIVIQEEEGNDAFTVENSVISNSTIKAKINANENGTVKTEKLVFVLSNGGTTMASSAKSIVFTRVVRTIYTSFEVKDLTPMFVETRDGATINSDYAKQIEVYGVLANGTKVKLPTTQFDAKVNQANLTVTNGTISQNNTEVAEDYFIADGKNVTKTVPVLVTVKGESGDALAVVEKNLVLTNVAPKVTEIEVSSDVVNGKAFVNKGAITNSTLNSFIDYALDQYEVESSEIPTITITKLVKVDGSSLNIQNNGTKEANITGAEVGDKFTVSYKYASGKAVNVDFTVGTSAAGVQTRNVSTADGLANAISASQDGDTIKLLADIESNVMLSKLVNLDLNGKTLTGNVVIDSITPGTLNIGAGTITGDLTVNTPNATVNNNATVSGTITITEVAEGTWNENANGNDIVVNDATGITLNVVKGKTVKSLVLNEAAKVMVAEGSTVTTLNIKKVGSTVVNHGTVTTLNAEAKVEIEGEAPKDVIGAENVIGAVSVKDSTELFNALNNAEVTEINLTNDIEVDKQVKPAANVTLNGNGNKLTFNNEADGNNTAEGLYIANKGITVKNIIIDNKANESDNLIEIYSSVNLDTVTVKNSKKAGIYVNNDGSEKIAVTFKNITTLDNAWAGIGLVSQNEGSEVMATFEGNNSFAEATHVYSDAKYEGGTYEEGKANLYKGTVKVVGLGDPVVNDKGQNVWTLSK